ncbi:MAG: hypothetical protein E2P02_00840 [Acidobacteria bacterium]|nr:MAG: hypothetical protein E2P02_00840 [Acidobacteriota bacterium]
MLTPDNKVKILDFGLAKAFTEDAPDADSSMSPTITRDATRVGVILGTAAYMSPEQAKGKKVDKCTDIFAFGALLYEMLAGKKAFPGEDIPEVLASVINLEPDWDKLPSQTPWRMRELLRRWVHDVERQTSSRLTFDPALDSNPLWAPDGTRVFFASRRAGRPDLFSKASDGSGKAEPIEFRRSDELLDLRPEAFTADGLTLLTVERSAGGTDLGKLTLLEEPVYEPLLNEPFEERWPALSPDGRFIAYAAADEAGSLPYLRPPLPRRERWPLRVDAAWGQLAFLGT